MSTMKNNFTLNRADSALLARDFSLAARLYRSILAKEPSNMEVLLKLGSTYVKAGQDGKAEGAYVSVLRLDPSNFEALNSLGGVFRRLGKYKDSIKVLERALKIKNSSDVMYNMGFTYRLMEEYDSAADCFTAVIEDNPNDVLAYNHLGAIQARRGEHKKALQTYWKGLQVDQNHPVLHFNSAISYLALGDYKEARNSYENALRAKPGWPDAMNGLAELYIQGGDFPNAQELISQAIKINPENTNLQVTQGRLYVKRGNYSEAESVYRSVLNKRPDDYSVMGRLEKVYEKTNRFDEAYNMLDRMENTQGSGNDLTKRKIQLLINQGKLKDAGNLLNQERTTSPDDPEVLSLLSQYFVRAGKIDKAHGCFKRICEVKPGSVAFLKDTAMQFMRMGDYEKAEDYIKKFLDKSPENVEALNCLGNIYEEQKRYDESLEVFKKLLEKDGDNPVTIEAVSRVGSHAESDTDRTADVNTVLSGVSGNESPEELQEKIRMYENSVGSIEKFAVSDDQKPVDNAVGQDIDSFEKIDFDELLKLEYKDIADSESESDYSELIMEDSPVDFESDEYDDRKESMKTSDLMPQDMPFEFNSGTSDDVAFNPLDYNFTSKYPPLEKNEVLDVNGPFFEEDKFEELEKPKKKKAKKKLSYRSPSLMDEDSEEDPDLPPEFEASEPGETEAAISSEAPADSDEKADEEQPFYEEDVEPGDDMLLPEEDESSEEKLPSQEDGQTAAEDSLDVPFDEEAEVSELPEEDEASEENAPEESDIEENAPEDSDSEGKGLLEAADALKAEDNEEDVFPEEEPEEPVPLEMPDDAVYKGNSSPVREQEEERRNPEIKEDKPSGKDEKTTMDLVFDALQNSVDIPVEQKFRNASDMFRTLRNLSSSLSQEKKDALFKSLNKHKLDYVVERLSSKPGLLSAASAIRKTGGIKGIKTGLKPSLLKKMTYMRTLIKSLPEVSQAWLL
ncbi:MAG: tetratricopeptide repeat protein [Treponemataceae bacterium]|nr:tetratricopeptide repeat protein [Treponemataceae bacterium]